MENPSSNRHGCELQDIFNSRDCWSYQSPDLSPNRNHTVLYRLPLPTDSQTPIPYDGTDIWDPDHVRMPCNPQSQYPEIDVSGNKILKRRWDLIQESLLKPILSSYELEHAIKSYNTRYEKIWDFSALHELVQIHLSHTEVRHFFDVILPRIIYHALSLPDLIKSPIPLLRQHSNKSISMSQEQAACILANSFLCTWPRRNTDKKNSEFSSFPEINFNKLFGCQGDNIFEKLKCIINYFHRVLVVEMPKNVITFQRTSASGFNWDNSGIPLSGTKFHVSSIGKIEEGEGMLQVDFANRFVGGGVLGHGCVQEEIRFLINPELIVAKLFTESLKDDEALLMIGCEQFSNYYGYASSFKFGGNFIDTTPVDAYRRRKTRIVAIDALSFNDQSSTFVQFKEATIRRDLDKAFVGFYGGDRSPVASGLWGCGAFGGYTIRSALIQLMACAVTERNLVFYTFGDNQSRDEICDIFEFLTTNQVSVGKLYRLLKSYRYDGDPKDPTKLVPFIKSQVEEMNRKKIAQVSSPTPMIQPKIFGIPKKPKQSVPESSTSSGSSGKASAAVVNRRKFASIEETFSIVATKLEETKPEEKKSFFECLADYE